MPGATVSSAKPDVEQATGRGSRGSRAARKGGRRSGLRECRAAASRGRWRAAAPPGPGSSMQKLRACRKRSWLTQRFSSTRMRCITAIWPAGPPKERAATRVQTTDRGAQRQPHAIAPLGGEAARISEEPGHSIAFDPSPPAAKALVETCLFQKSGRPAARRSSSRAVSGPGRCRPPWRRLRSPPGGRRAGLLAVDVVDHLAEYARAPASSSAKMSQQRPRKCSCPRRDRTLPRTCRSVARPPRAS